MLMTLHRLLGVGWIEAGALVPYLQLPRVEVDDVVNRLTRLSLAGSPVLRSVRGVPLSAAPAWTLSAAARRALRQEDDMVSRRRSVLAPQAVAAGYAEARGRISSTELGSLTGRAATNVGPVLRSLEQDGLLRPSRANRAGAGFYYQYVPPGG